MPYKIDPEAYIRKFVIVNSDINFTSTGKLTVTSFTYSTDLDVEAAVKIKPFTMRIDLYHKGVIPVFTIIVKDENFTFINYLEKTVYIGKTSCKKRINLWGITWTKEDLISVLYGKPILPDLILIQKENSPNLIIVEDEHGCKKIMRIEKDSIYLSSASEDSALEISFPLDSEDGNITYEKPITLTTGQFKTTVTYKRESLNEHAHITDEIFDQPVPRGFMVKSLEELH